MDHDRAEVDGSRRTRAAMFAAGVLLVGIPFLLAIPPAGLDGFDPGRRGSLRITDRDGRLLRDAPVRGTRASWVALQTLPPWVPEALVVAEDRRFFHHPGVDPVALGRAALADAKSGRIVSGGSTITQQVIRLMRDAPSQRTAIAKAGEIVDALRLECRFEKRDILEFYMNRLAFGRGAVGIEAAAQKYFGHAASTLSPAEAAWLAVLPRAPGFYSRPEWAVRLEKRRLEVVERLRRSHAIDSEAGSAARLPPALRTGGVFPFEAPHLTGWLIDQLPANLRGRAGTLTTTIDGPLQDEIEDIVKTQVARLSERGARQAAVVVIDNATEEVLAMVGSADFFDESAGGQVNGALARRQPGSALKPFTYALAFENGFTPASLVADVPAAFPAVGGPFVPRNYGGATFGPVRLREALGSSLNIAAVELLAKVGSDRLFAFLRSLHLLRPDATPELYGLGLTLGVGEVRLLDLTAAYSALASGGDYREPVALSRASDPAGRRLPLERPAPPVRLIEPLAGWWIGDILTDDAARYRSFGRGGVLDMPWPVAAKTGTSSDWRDNWAMGYTRERTVGVWVGDFSGEPMQRVSGVYGAAPILREVFHALSRRGTLTRAKRPPGLRAVTICSLSGAPANSECPGRLVEWFPDAAKPDGSCSFHGARSERKEERVTLPPEYQAWARDRGWDVAPNPTNEERGTGLRLVNPAGDEVYFLDPALPAGSQSVVFEARSDTHDDALDWRLDGRDLGRTRFPHRLPWSLAAGLHRLTVTDGRSVQSVGFRVDGAAVRGRAAARSRDTGR